MRKPSNLTLFVIAGLLVAAGLALFVSPLASGDPDGLNRVAIDKGFAESERDHALNDSPVAGYAVKGVDNEALATALSGLIGVLITFGVGLGLFALMRTVRARSDERAHLAVEERT
jgi:cobalt/nickel transport protein